MHLPRATLRRLEQDLRRLDDVRERALALSRSIGRDSREAMYALHRGDRSARLLKALRSKVAEVTRLGRSQPGVFEMGAVEAALQEYTEASLLAAILNRRAWPTPEALRVPSVPYLLGMADLIGELRRTFQDSLKSDDGSHDRAEALLRMMEELFQAIMRFDEPDSLLPIRRKQDIARGLLERTRAELALAQRGHELERRLRQLEHHLDRPAPKRRKNRSSSP